MTDLGASTGFVAASAAKATTTASFSADVLTVSQRQPVVVHFLSPRSDACRTLQESLERAVRKAGDKVRLVTMDIDAHPQIASRLGIRGVPAVYAFQRGQPIDGFMGPLPDAQVKGFLERLVGGPVDNGTAEMLEEAETSLGSGDAETAAALSSAILEAEPDNVAATGLLVRALVMAGDLATARSVLEQLPTSALKDRFVVAAQAALDNAAQASALGDLGDLQRAVEADPDDHRARLDLAVGLNGRNERDAAADCLLESIRRDRGFEDGAARKQLLQFFEAWGLMDPSTLAARRKLSTLLFS